MDGEERGAAVRWTGSVGIAVFIVSFLAAPLRAQAADPRRVNYWCDRARATIEQLASAGTIDASLSPRMLAMELAHVRGDARDLELLGRVVELASVRDEGWQLDRAATHWHLGERDQAEAVLKQLEGDEKMRGVVDGVRLALGGRVPPGRDYDTQWLRDHAPTASLHFNTQAYGIAVEQYRQLAEQNGHDPDMRRSLFHLLLRGEDPTAAVRLAQGFATADQRIDGLVRISEQCGRIGAVRSARSLLRDAAETLVTTRQKVSISCAIRLAEAAWDLGMPEVSAEVTDWTMLRAEVPQELLRLVPLRERMGDHVDLAQLERLAYSSPGEGERADAMERKKALLAVATVCAWRDNTVKLRQAMKVLKGLDADGEPGSEEIPLAYAQKGRIRDAANLAKELLRGEMREYAMLRILRETLRQERFDDVVWCMERFSKTSAGQYSGRRAALTAGVYLARAGRLDEVERIANGLAEPDVKAGLFLVVAKEIQGTGQLGLLSRLW